MQEKFSRENLSIAVQITILVIVFQFGVDAWLSRIQDYRRKEIESRRIFQIQDLGVLSDREIFPRARFFALVKLFRQNRLPILSKISKKYKETWAADFNLYRFSPGGELIESAPENAPNLWLMKCLAKGFVSNSERDFELVKKQTEKKIPYVFGDGKEITNIRADEGKYIEVFANNENGGFLWASGSQGLLMIHCPRSPDEGEVFRRIWKKRNLEDSATVGYSRQGSSEFLRLGKEADSRALQAWEGLKNQNLRFGTFDGSWWSFQETSSGRTLYGVFPQIGDEYSIFRWGLPYFSVFLIFMTWWLLLTFPLALTLKLKKILVVLFLGASVVPMLGIATGSFDLMKTYEEVTGTRIASAQNEALLSVAKVFDEYLIGRGSLLEKITAEPGKGTDTERNTAILNKVREAGFLDQFAFRDAAGGLLFSNQPVSSAERETFNRSFARQVIAVHSPERLGELPYKGNSVTDNVMKIDGMGFSDLIRQDARVKNVQGGIEEYLLYFRVYPKNVGGVAYAEAKIPLLQGAVNYLREKASRRIGFRDLDFRLFAFDIRSLRWSVSPPPQLRKELTRAALRAWLSGQTESLRIRTPNSSGFSTALFSQELSAHSLVVFCTDRILNERIARGWGLLLAGGLLFLLLLWILVRGISENLLSPLGELEEGAQALIRRDFDYRLAATDAGEMGSLFRAFNEMMNDSQDLQVAGKVQEGLIPHVFPVAEGYSITGKIFMASDLGGDLLDCFSLPDGRVVFLVGDVSGHDVGSALLMAFAKAVTFHWSQGCGLNPAILADHLDRALRSQTTRNFMGTICGILDPARHEIEFNVSGHVFPVIIRGNGPGELVGEPALPLGSSKKARDFPTIRLELKRGDALLCVTDGFPEGLNSRGEMVGYDRLVKWASETHCNDVEKWLESLFSRHAEWAPKRLDDVTLFAINRLVKSEQGS